MEPPLLALAITISAALAAATGGLPAASITAGKWIDSIIWIVGLGITGCVALWWTVYDRRDPLRIAPHRRHRLGLESVMIAAGVYIMAVMALAYFAPPATPPLRGDSPNSTPAAESESSAPEAVAKPDPAATARAVRDDSIAKIIGVAVCLVLVARDFDGGIRRFLFGRRGGAQAAALGVVLGIVSLPLCYGVLWMTEQVLLFFLPDYRFDDHTTIQLLREGAHSPWVVCGLYFGAAVIAPVGEEVFFRGILQTVLASTLRSRWPAIVLAAGAFAVLHGQLHVLPPLFLLGILLGYGYERTGAMITPLLIHALFNGKTLLWNALWPGG